MWKIILAFVVFAALAMFLLMKGGANVDMGGEKHGAEAVHAPAAASAPAAAEPASAPTPSASAASS